jgi:broad specificity phosphatase PhoE
MDYFAEKLVVIFHEQQKKRRPKRIILVRHGNSIANNNYDVLKNIPDNKIHLSEKGVEQAKLAGKRLKELIGNESIQFYVSPYQRTKDTYKYILESLKDNHSDCIVTSILREQEYGNLQSEMDKQFEEQKKVGVFFYRFINGESGADVHARMSIFLQYLFRRILSIDYHSFDNIVIVSHELTIKFFMMNFMNLPVTELDNIKKIDNAQFWTLEKNEYGKYILKDDIFINKKE